MRGSIKFAINIPLLSDGRPTQVTPEDVDQRVFCETKDDWLEWNRCEGLSTTTKARLISSLLLSEEKSFEKCAKTSLCDHLMPLHFQQSTVAFETLESRLNYMPALPSKIKLWEHKVIFYCYALYTSMVCSGECTFHHITACGGTTLCSNVASPGILIYAASCFYHPASWSPWEVGGLGLWLHTEPLVPVLVSSCWHISLWVAESRLGNDKW